MFHWSVFPCSVLVDFRFPQLDFMGLLSVVVVVVDVATLEYKII